MKITVEIVVMASLDEVWKAWNTPEDIIQWNAASDDWHTPDSKVDLRPGGKIWARMEAKDGNMGFDFEGTYTSVVNHKLIEFTMPDNRTVSVTFETADGGVKITEIFDADNEYPVEMQREGWQSILQNFKRYVEGKTIR